MQLYLLIIMFLITNFYSALIPSTIIELSGVSITGVGQYHSLGSIQNSATNYRMQWKLRKDKQVNIIFHFASLFSVHTYIHTDRHIYKHPPPSTHIQMHTHTHAHTHAHTYTQTHIHIHTHTYTHTSTHTHIHIKHTQQDTYIIITHQG